MIAVADASAVGRAIMSILVNVYYARRTSWSPESIAAARALLDGEERARADRFHFDRDRSMYTAAHALLRRALSRHAGADPSAFRFVVGSHGRPEIASPASVPRLRFSLSHTRGVVACAIAADVDIGIDVEDVDRNAPLEVADRWFAPAEVAALSALPEAIRADRFFVYWTLKEAYVKARGLGLSLPLHAFALDVAEPRIRVAFDADCPDDANAWSFRSWLVEGAHRAGLAVRTSSDLTISVSKEEPDLAT